MCETSRRSPPPPPAVLVCRQSVARRRELRLEPLRPLGRVRGRRFSARVPHAIHGRQRLVDAHAVLAHVEAHGAETEHADFAAQRQEQCVGEALCTRFGERVAREIDVVDQAVGVTVTELLGAGSSRSAWSIVTSIRASTQLKNCRKISPRLRAARSSPSGAARMARATPRERFRQRQRMILDGEIPHQIEHAGAVAAQGRKPRLHKVRRVTSLVTYGFPSRSPPIHEPNCSSCGTSSVSRGKCLANSLSALASICGTTSNRFSLKK